MLTIVQNPIPEREAVLDNKKSKRPNAKNKNQNKMCFNRLNKYLFIVIDKVLNIVNIFKMKEFQKNAQND